MAASTIVKNNIGGSITLSDGSGSPVTLVLAFEKGDCTITGLSSTLNSVVEFQARGKAKGIAHGPRIYPKISFTAFFSPIGTGTDTQDILSFWGRKGAYTANVSTSGVGRPDTVKLTLKVESTNLGEASDYTMIFDQVSLDSYDFSESIDGGNTVSISGTCYASSITIGALTYSEVA